MILVGLHALFDLFYNFYGVDDVLRFEVVALGLFLPKDDHLPRSSVSLVGGIADTLPEVHDEEDDSSP